MKKTIALIIVLSLAMTFVPVFSASSLPFTDEDYMREDFNFKDYDPYIKDSINENGYMWPEGTKAISWESTVGPKNILQNKPLQLPRDIEIIGFYAFTGRSDITEDSVDFETLTELKYIGEGAFRDTKVKRVDLSKTKVVKIQPYAFYTESLSTFVAPPTLKYIGEYAFARRCNVEYIELNEGLEYIGNMAFNQYKGTLVIPSTVKYIGYNIMPYGQIYVYKGSYAEQWCKDNNRKYNYAEGRNIAKEKVEEGEKETHISHNVGPIKFDKYYTHFVGDQTFDNGEEHIFFRVLTEPGVSIETLYDGVELYYTPYRRWTLNEENMKYVATTDKQTFTGFRNGVANIQEYGMSFYPSEKLDFGWTKGLKWTLNPSKLVASKDQNLVAEYKGVRYEYEISLGWSEEYNEARNNPDYNKLGYDEGTKIYPSEAKIISDGTEYNVECYNFWGNNYFKLRDVATFVNGSKKQFNVEWNSQLNSVEISTNKAYASVGSELKKADGEMKLSYSACPSPVYCDGKEIVLRTKRVDGNNYIMLRDLGQIIDFEILWDDANKCIVINTSKGYTK